MSIVLVKPSMQLQDLEWLKSVDVKCKLITLIPNDLKKYDLMMELENKDNIEIRIDNGENISLNLLYYEESLYILPDFFFHLIIEALYQTSFIFIL